MDSESQYCGSVLIGTDPDPYPIRIQGFDDKKLKKIYS